MIALKKTSIALLVASLAVGLLGIDANAAAPVTKPTKVTVVTTGTTATVSWAAFPKGKVTSIKVVSTLGSKKVTKTVSATAKSYRFTGLKSNTSYTFSVFGVKGTKSSTGVSVKGKTKIVRMQNLIFFPQPKDMTVGDADQKILALPYGGDSSFTTTTPAICSIVNGNYVKAIAMGECVIVASASGDAYYAPAPNETRTISISTPIDGLQKTLLWSDEFDGAEGDGPSTSNWVIEEGDGCNAAPGCGWGNGESQSYAQCAIKQTGTGFMKITASTPAGDATCLSNKNWTSGKFTTQGKQHFTYGYFEARLKMPVGGGTWPAFWTLSKDIKTIPWPHSGELDIMEYAGNSPTRSTSAAHYANNLGLHEYKSGSQSFTSALSEDFHTYGMLWLPNEVQFTFDGRTFYTLKKSMTGLTNWPFGPNANGVDPKMYVIFNLAMGGNYGGRIAGGYNKATFEIDYVRYYSVGGYGSAPTNN